MKPSSIMAFASSLTLIVAATGHAQPITIGDLCDPRYATADEGFESPFCDRVDDLVKLRRQLNKITVINRHLLNNRRVYFDSRNKPSVYFDIGPNPAGWKTSIDDIFGIGTVVSYLKRADNVPNDPVVGVERARLTMAVFKTSSPALESLRGILDRYTWSDFPIQYTWDRPSAYRDGVAYSVAVDYSSASPVSAVMADPIKATRIAFDHADAYGGAHYFNVYSLEDAVEVLTAFRRALIDVGDMLHCHTEGDPGDEGEPGLTLRTNGGYDVDTLACTRTRLTREGVPSQSNGEHVIVANGIAPHHSLRRWADRRDAEWPAPSRGQDLRLTFHAGSFLQAVEFIHLDARDGEAVMGPVELPFRRASLVVEMKIEHLSGDSRISFMYCDPDSDYNTSLTHCLGHSGFHLESADWVQHSWRTVALVLRDVPASMWAPMYIESRGVGDEDMIVSIRSARWVSAEDLPPQAVVLEARRTLPVGAVGEAVAD